MTVSAHRVDVTIDGTDFADVEGTLTLDVSWAPYVQGEVVVPWSSAIEALDPRVSNPPRVYLTARQVFGDSSVAAELSAEFEGLSAAALSSLWAGRSAFDVGVDYFTPWNAEDEGIPAQSSSRSFNLTLREVSTDHGTGLTTLRVASDEALLQDFGLVESTPRVFQSTSVRSIVAEVLRAAGFALTPGTADGTIEEPTATWEPAQSGWDALVPLVQAAGLRLYSDGTRRWVLEVATPETTGHVELSTTDTVTGLTYSRDRSGEWCDAVVIAYRWQTTAADGTTTDHVRYDTARNGTGSKVLGLTYEQRYPGPGAARHVLDRKATLGEVIPVEAVSSYDVEPGYSFQLHAVGRPPRAGRVAAVTWEWPADTMQITATDIVTE